MADKSKPIIRILVLIIVLLALVILYAFVVKPAVTGYAINNLQEGYVQGYQQAQVDLLNNIVTQLQQAGNAQIPVGENQVLVLQGQIFNTQQTGLAQ